MVIQASFAYTLDIIKLGNIPGLLRQAADEYEALIVAGTNRIVKDIPLHVILKTDPATTGLLTVIET